jgi:hypothetical protein
MKPAGLPWARTKPVPSSMECHAAAPSVEFLQPIVPLSEVPRHILQAIHYRTSYLSG